MIFFPFEFNFNFQLQDILLVFIIMHARVSATDYDKAERTRDTVTTIWYRMSRPNSNKN